MEKSYIFHETASPEAKDNHLKEGTENETTILTMAKAKVTMEVTTAETTVDTKVVATKVVITEVTTEVRKETTKAITTKVVVAEKAQETKEKARLIIQAGPIHMSGPWVDLWTT